MIRSTLLLLLLWFKLVAETSTELSTIGVSTGSMSVLETTTWQRRTDVRFEISEKSETDTITHKSAEDVEESTTHSFFLNNVTESYNTSNSTSELPRPAPVNPFAIMNEGFVSKQQYEMSSLVINVVLKPVVCTCGIVMNIVGVCVLLHKHFRRSTYTYLCFLSMSDVGYLLCGLIRSIPKIVTLRDPVSANYIDMHIFPYITMYFDFVFTRFSVFIICALSIERFMAVLRPMKVRELFLSRFARPFCVFLLVFCLLLYVHNLFIYYPLPKFNPTLNITMYAVGRRPWYANSLYKPIFSQLHDIVNLYLPPVVLLVCNIGILYRVYSARAKRAKLFEASADSKQNQDQIRMTITLLVISFFFLVVFIPVIVVTFLSRYDKNIKAFGREHYFLFLMADVTSLGWSMSSANDFIVYIFTSKQFRVTLLRMFGREPMKQINKSSETLTSSAPSVSNSNYM